MQAKESIDHRSCLALASARTIDAPTNTVNVNPPTKGLAEDHPRPSAYTSPISAITKNEKRKLKRRST